jgi:hypothetical protein
VRRVKPLHRSRRRTGAGGTASRGSAPGEPTTLGRGGTDLTAVALAAALAPTAASRDVGGNGGGSQAGTWRRHLPVVDAVALGCWPNWEPRSSTRSPSSCSLRPVAAGGPLPGRCGTLHQFDPDPRGTSSWCALLAVTQGANCPDQPRRAG